MKRRPKTRPICSHRSATRHKKIKGDIAGALKELHSKENVKGLATAMITAGLVQGLGAEFGLVSGGKATLLQNLQTNLVNGVAGSLVSTAINGGSLEDNLKNAIKTALISTAGAQLANGIGNITNDNKLDQTDIEKFANKFAHAVLGCALGAATADSSAGCGAGALGAVAGSLGAELFDPANTKGAQAQQFGKLTAALAVLLVGGNANLMNIGGMTAVNAVANNRQLHKDELALAKTLAEKAKALGLPISEEDIKVQMQLMGNAALKVAPNTLTTLSPAQLAQSRNGVQDAIPYVSDGLSNPVSYLEVAGQANQSIQDFIVSNTTSGAGYIPGQSPYIASNPSLNDPVTSGPPSKVIPTAKCAYLDAGCIAGTNHQQNPSKPMTLAERKAAGEYFGNLSTQYQMIATLAVAGGQTGAPVVLTYEIAAGIAGLLEQGFAPSTGKVIIDTVVVDLAVKQIAERFGVPISIANIVAEKYIKPNLQGAKDSIDNIGNKK